MWVNGEHTKTVSILDRGLSYGDGIFTTIKVIDGQCELLSQHITRLEQGITRLSITPINLILLRNDLVAKAQKHSTGVLKVMVTRGEGKRGYSSLGCDSPNIIIIAGNLPDYQSHQTNGIKLGVSNVTLGINPLTAGIKHLNRLEQVLVKQDIDEQEWTDALVLDCQGYIVETSMANVFWRIGNNVYTPSLEFSGVNGLMRQQVIKTLNEQSVSQNSEWASITIIENRFILNDILKADEVFITNCLMGIVPIIAIDNNSYQIGDITNKLSGELNNKEES